jgi:hypothetical protein
MFEVYSGRLAGSEVLDWHLRAVVFDTLAGVLWMPALVR